MSDFKKATSAIVDLLQDRVVPLRTNLRAVARLAGISNTPLRALFTVFKDVLTVPDVTFKLGREWCLAEISGLDVQFSPVVCDESLVDVVAKEENSQGQYLSLLRSLSMDAYCDSFFKMDVLLDAYVARKDVLDEVLPPNLLESLRLACSNRASDFHHTSLKEELFEYFTIGQHDKDRVPDEDEFQSDFRTIGKSNS